MGLVTKIKRTQLKKQIMFDIDDNLINENVDNESKPKDKTVIGDFDELWDYYSGLPNPKWYETNQKS